MPPAAIAALAAVAIAMMALAWFQAPGCADYPQGRVGNMVISGCSP